MCCATSLQIFENISENLAVFMSPVSAHVNIVAGRRVAGAVGGGLRWMDGGREGGSKRRTDGGKEHMESFG